MNSTNSTNTITREAPGIAEPIDVEPSGKAMWWLAWLACVLLVRFFMVERKLDGARFGIIGCLTGAIGTIGDGDDHEWVARWRELQEAKPSTTPSGTLDNSTISDGAASAHGVGLAVGNARVGMWQVRLRRKLWIRWIVDLFSWHRMYWFGPSTQDHESNPQPSRRRLATARHRYGDEHTSEVTPANADDLILVYGTKSMRIAEGSGRLDDFSRDKRWKAQRYGFYYFLFGTGLCIRSVQVGIATAITLELLLLCSWHVGRNLSPDHQDFCNRVSRSAECIEQAARELVPGGRGEGGGGKRTLDVVLCYGTTAAWCRCAPTEHPTDPERTWDNNTWISLCIPKSNSVADTIFAGLGLLAHTLLPWGWVQFPPNIFFASLAAIAEGIRPGSGVLVVLILAPGPLWTGYPGGIWQHEDNWTLAWYVCLTQCLSGHAVDFRSLVEWIEQFLGSAQ